MIDEYQSIMKSDVWEIVPRLERKLVVTSKWIYKIKHVVDGSIEKHKSRFMTGGFSYNEETFAPVVRYTSIISMLALVVVMRWKIH